jgi:hypothetical protein
MIVAAGTEPSPRTTQHPGAVLRPRGQLRTGGDAAVRTLPQVGDLADRTKQRKRLAVASAGGTQDRRIQVGDERVGDDSVVQDTARGGISTRWRRTYAAGARSHPKVAGTSARRDSSRSMRASTVVRSSGNLLTVEVTAKW